NAECGADRHLAIARRIEREAEAWSEVRVLALIRAVEAIRAGGEQRPRREIVDGEPVVLLARNAVELPTQARIDSQVRVDLIVVLRVEVQCRDVQRRIRREGLAGRGSRNSREEVGQRGERDRSARTAVEVVIAKSPELGAHL